MRLSAPRAFLLYATEKTEIRVVYDERALYIGMVCQDFDPRLIVSKEMRRDGEIEADDNISIIIDTYHDHATCTEQPKATARSVTPSLRRWAAKTRDR